MNSKRKRWQLPFLLFLIVGTALILRHHNAPRPYQTNQGKVFGTFYHISYQSDEDLQAQIEQALARVDGSLSPFNDTSVITRINNNQDVVPDSLFMHVFNLSKLVSKDTNGAFDITVAPLVNAWGFGFKTGIDVDSATVDSLRRFIGIDKVWSEEARICKQLDNVMLDCSSVAKGFGCDVVARLFDARGIANYMIEIGGEIVMKGKNSRGGDWTIGINKPVDDSLNQNQEFQSVISLTDKGMATSGNYRNFYFKDGKKYAHTIDPRTGYPVQRNILSATVVADDCATADAYATAFMVLGLDSAMMVCDRHPEMDAYFIYVDPQGEVTTHATKGMEKYIKE